MTIYSKTSLKTFFETGDVPAGQQYADMIDSSVNLAETAQQSMAGPLSTTELIAAQVSAGNITVTGTFSAANFATTNFVATTVSAGTINSTGNITASASTIYSNTLRTVEGMYGSTGIVSAGGTAQSTATPLTYFINRGTGVSDGQTTGFGLLANRQGLVQYIINGGASANLWPPTGGQINALASNAAFGMAANTPYTIIHTLSSGYAVK